MRLPLVKMTGGDRLTESGLIGYYPGERQREAERAASVGDA